jgi:Domain of unknown function (DUF4259)
MGAWAEGAFDNDDAADWAAQFDGADQEAGLRLIEDTLRQAAQASSGGYLDLDVGAQVVAAAELVTCVAGQPVRVTPYNESALWWAARVSPRAAPSLVGLALRAVARVTGPESELASLWDETGTSWRVSMTDLASRLQAVEGHSPNTDDA